MNQEIKKTKVLKKYYSYLIAMLIIPIIATIGVYMNIPTIEAGNANGADIDLLKSFIPFINASHALGLMFIILPYFFLVLLNQAVIYILITLSGILLFLGPTIFSLNTALFGFNENLFGSQVIPEQLFLPYAIIISIYSLVSFIVWNINLRPDYKDFLGIINNKN